MIFTSDNAGGVAPEILAAIAEASAGTAMPYGNDPLTQRVEAMVRERFEAPEARVFLVGTGTAANALALACLCPPWGAVFAHEMAHVEHDECGAPEFYTGGAKLTLVPGEDGRMTADGLAAAAGAPGSRPVHEVQHGAVTVSQATEWGTLYDRRALAEIAASARARGMGVHMDGTRFSNAIARTGASPADMSWRAGVDVLCLGATKNGAMAAEAVILFDPARAREFELRRKRGGHLFSKMRFVAAQMAAWLEDDLWLRLAARANAAADRLAEGIAGSPGCSVLNPVEANMLFVEMPASAHARLREAGAAYYLRGEDGERVRARLVCSNQTTEEEVERFVALLHG